MKKSKAFTMFEISLVFAVITVIVAVSIRITKAKFDSLNRYLYYAAHSMLQASVKEVFLDRQFPEGSRSYEKTKDASGNNNRYEFLPQELNAGPLVSLYKICKPIGHYLNNKSVQCDRGGNNLNMLRQANFSNLAAEPDIILSNGIKIYNLNGLITKQSPSTSGGVTYSNLPMSLPFQYTDMNGTPGDYEKGYIVFVDINGNSGNTALWEDIFPFYVVASKGDVIPAWENDLSDNTPDKNYGPKDSDIMKAGVYNNAKNTYVSGERGLTYQEAICKAGVIAGDYCESIGVIDACKKATGTDEDPHDCSVKILPPIKT